MRGVRSKGSLLKYLIFGIIVGVLVVLNNIFTSSSKDPLKWVGRNGVVSVKKIIDNLGYKDDYEYQENELPERHGHDEEDNVDMLIMNQRKGEAYFILSS